MAALDTSRLAREWGHQWLITGPHVDRTYTATRKRPRGDRTDRLRVRTLRALRRQLEALDDADRDDNLSAHLNASRPAARRSSQRRSGAGGHHPT